MKKAIDKVSKVSVVALAIILSITALAALPTTSAQTVITKQAYAVISVTPNPAGAGQYVYIVGGITDQTVWPQPGWKDITVYIQRPDGKTDTLKFNTFTTGIGGITYKTDIPGVYKIKLYFPQQEVTVANTAVNLPAGSIMKEAWSREIELVVREEPVPVHPGFPLPNEYWTRPIDPQLREWACMAGNWLGQQTFAYYTRYNPFNIGPEAPHVLWMKVLDEGGLIGGWAAGYPTEQFGDDIAEYSYEHGDAYEGKWVNPIVINGILYYNLYPAQDTSTARMVDPNFVVIEQKVVAVDIHTGEELWRRTLGDNERLSYGQIMYWESQNMIGAFAYLWTVVGTTWKAYDPLTGRYEYSIKNVPSGWIGRGQKGEFLIYTVNTAAGWMTQWNSTKAVYQSLLDIWAGNPAQIYYANRWRPHGATFDGLKGYDWNVTIPRLPGSVECAVPFDFVLGSNTALFTRQPNPVFWALSLKPGEIGRLKFNISWTPPVTDAWVDIPGSEPVDVENRIFIVACKDTRQYWAFNLDTGRLLWGPQDYNEPDFNSYSIIYFAPWGQSVVAFGKLYTAGYGGEVNAYDIKTGKHLWSYTVADPYNEFTWGNWPSPIYLVTGDGKIYIGHQEHSGNPPLPRGAPFVCLNATTGEEIFRVDGLVRSTRWGGQPVIADSIIIWFDTYSNVIFAIGEGPSQTTVAVQRDVVALGEPVLIKGSVLDVSPGVRDSRISLRFPGGVPAVDDESVGDWMLYVYKQFPLAHDLMVKGVWVAFDAVDPDGNYVQIGGTFTDGRTGQYAIPWTPDKPGLWTIITHFPGSKSYYPSSATTTILVTTPPAPPTPASPEQVNTIQTTLEAMTPLMVALMVLVIIAILVSIYCVYTIRKRQ